MSEEKKIRPMTEKRFAKLNLSAKATAEGLLAQHMAFLENHEFLKDILEAYKNKDLLPTPTLQACQNLLWMHIMESELKTAQAKIAENIDTYNKALKDENGNVISTSSGPTGKYLITLMVKAYTNDELTGEEVGTVSIPKLRQVEKDGKMVDEKYNEIKPAIYGEDDYGAAERKADRLLVAREDSLYAIIENTFGTKVQTHVMRGDAFARIFRKQKNAVMRERGKSTKSLKFGVKAKNDRSVGPWSIRR